ncbi:MAG TPA: hypothetical protein VG692_14730 [Gemmatimonadales bacterium]|nr:hypothetical protein [Gemmatimonadales bacterium]
MMRAGAAGLAAVSLLAKGLPAQGPVTLRVSVQAIPSVTSVDPIPGGGTLTEGRVVQPVAMLHAAGLGGHLRFLGTLNLEGQTIPHGELTPGAWGEGFNDRRHPHTYAHELLLSGVDLLGRRDGGAVVSITAGKGFAPFGSDDPMSRPVLRYPVNHHLAQILERAVVQAGVRVGPAAIEAGLFNGDEPERPGQWPRVRGRFGDSWSARLTVFPVAGVELSASRAKVHSPEHRPGAGTDAWKWHVAGRLDRRVGPGRGYALVEWARTEEAEGFFVFRSVLGEASYSLGQGQIYYRFERSDRPEDSRELDPFRSVRPHLENSILGITRFTLHTVGVSRGFQAARARLEIRPFVEGTLGRARNTDGGILTPEALYGKDTIREVSAGVRLMWQMRGHRMGRYGDLLDAGTHHGDMHHLQDDDS